MPDWIERMIAMWIESVTELQHLGSNSQKENKSLSRREHLQKKSIRKTKQKYINQLSAFNCYSTFVKQMRIMD